VSRKFVWLLASSLMVVTLVLASCGQTSTTTTTTPIGGTTTPTTTVPTTTTTTTVSAETPKYGGTLTFSAGEPLGFDPVYTVCVNCYASLSGLCNNEMLEGDWTKGPAGTGETDWTTGFLGRVSLEKGSLAESWELPDDSTIIYHIRQGVHFWNKPPVNGREMTATDVAWSMQRDWTSPNSWNFTTWIPSERPLSFNATDKYTVVVKVPPAVQGGLLFQTAEQTHIYPTEVPDFRDWRLLQGTGPFLLTDYVPGSSLTYARNPNYFQNDPLHPENQLPYLNTCKQLIISDKATFLTALRTGKLDVSLTSTFAFTAEDYKAIVAQCPQVKSKTIAGTSVALWGRMDKDLPFNDLRVRQALNIAIDKQAIVDGYYSGSAFLFGELFPPLKAWEPLFTPLDKMPENVQMLFKYDLAKAKQLLADAGYPNGFTTQIVCGTSEQADYLSMVASYWAKAGIILQIKQMDNTQYTSMGRARSYPEMTYGGVTSSSFPWKINEVRKEFSDDKAYYENVKTRAAYNEAVKYVGKDDAKWIQVIKDIHPFILGEAVGVWMPLPYGYRVWWPWLQNYHGEGTIGYDNQLALSWYVWIDQNMKKSMGY
jgi:peptide/nickel transport system substrate-binding protein